MDADTRTVFLDCLALDLELAEEGETCLIRPLPVEKIGVVIPPEGLLPGGFAWHALHPPWERWTRCPTG